MKIFTVKIKKIKKILNFCKKFIKNTCKISNFILLYICEYFSKDKKGTF